MRKNQRPNAECRSARDGDFFALPHNELPPQLYNTHNQLPLHSGRLHTSASKGFTMCLNFYLHEKWKAQKGAYGSVYQQTRTTTFMWHCVFHYLCNGLFKQIILNCKKKNLISCYYPFVTRKWCLRLKSKYTQSINLLTNEEIDSLVVL